MGRNRFIITALISLFFSFSVYALPVGNPADAALLGEGIILQPNCDSWLAAVGLRFGFSGDYVFNRYLEVDRSGENNDIQQFEISTNAGYLGVSVCDRVELFGTVGASDMHIFTTSSSLFGILPGNIDIDTETSFSWSIGASGLLYRYGCFLLGARGEYFHTSPNINSLVVNGTEPIYFNDGNKMRLHSAQASLGLAYQINIACCENTALLPYGAIKWARASVDMDELTVIDPLSRQFAVLYNLNNKKSIGYALGMTLVGADAISFTVEGRFADELALHLNGQIRF